MKELGRVKTMKEILDKCESEARDMTELKRQLVKNNVTMKVLNESLYWNNRIIHSSDMQAPWVRISP